MKNSMLNINQIHSGYGEIKVLKDISFELNSGDILGILGRNGMGKSTLIKTIAGLLIPSLGKISFKNIDITQFESFKKAKQGITTVIQGRGIFSDLTVNENLIFGKIASGEKKENKIEEVFSYFPRLKERINQKAGTLSGGEQQMLAVGRAMMSARKLMLLDEPSMGLAPLLMLSMFEALKEINREGTTILLVEQNARLALKFAQRAYVLENGHLALEGPSEDLLHNPEVKKAYLGG